MSADTGNWVGQVLASGRYQVMALLGAGGMAFVYKALDLASGQVVVVKVPRQAMLEDPEFTGRFTREVKSLVRLEHPHIVKVLDVGEHERRPFLVLEYLSGGSLRDRLVGGPRLGQEVKAWLPGIASALDFCHENGCVHRDVKPDNILFDGEGKAYLSDFGIAKVISQAPRTRMTVLTGAGMVLGTAQYMAPELVMGHPYDGKVDQYGLAVTVYEALAGKVPFSGNTPAAVFVDQSKMEPPPLEVVATSVSKNAGAVVHRALGKDPKQRYRACALFAKELVTALDNGVFSESIQATTAPTTGTTPPQTSVTCPKCNKSFRVQSAVLGKRGKCAFCETVFELEARKTGQRMAGNTTRAISLGTQKPRRRRKVAFLGLAAIVLVGAGAAWLLLIPGTQPIAEPRIVLHTQQDRLDIEAGMSASLHVTVTRNGFQGIIVVETDKLPVEKGTGTLILKNDVEQGELVIQVPAHVQAGKASGFIVASGGKSLGDRKPLGLMVTTQNSVAEAKVPQSPKPMFEPIEPAKSESSKPVTIPTTTPAPQPSPFLDKFLELDLDAGIALKLVRILPGQFKMGSPETENQRSGEESEHDVEITQPFYMGIYEITQRQYKSVVGKNPSHFSDHGNGKGLLGEADPDHLPMESVTWQDAHAFCRQLSVLAVIKSKGLVCRLPTEAEWEYACRAKSRTVFHYGDSLEMGDANYYHEHPYGVYGETRLQGARNAIKLALIQDPTGNEANKLRKSLFLPRRTTKVGSYSPNEWGLFDMHGNVWEWCADWYDEEYYKASSKTDPTGPNMGEERVARGGSWNSSGANCRAASRIGYAPSRIYNNIGWGYSNVGFRVVVAQGPKAAVIVESGAKGKSPQLKAPSPSGPMITPQKTRLNIKVLPPGSGTAIVSASFTSTGKRLLIASGDTVFSGKKINPSGQAGLVLNDDAFSGRGGTIDVWDTEKSVRLGQLVGHTGPVYAVVCTTDPNLESDSEYAYSAGMDGRIRKWSLRTLSLQRVFSGSQNGTIFCLAITQDGKRIWSGSGGGIHEWDTSTGKQIRTVTRTSQVVCEIAFYQDLFLACGFGSVWLGEAQSGRITRTLNEGVAQVVVLSESGRAILTKAYTVKVVPWDIHGWKEVKDVTLPGAIGADQLSAGVQTSESVGYIWPQGKQLTKYDSRTEKTSIILDTPEIEGKVHYSLRYYVDSGERKLRSAGYEYVDEGGRRYRDFYLAKWSLK